MGNKEKLDSMNEIKEKYLAHMHEYRYLSGLSENEAKTRALFVVNDMDVHKNEYKPSLWELTDTGVKQISNSYDSVNYIWEDNDNILFSGNRDDEESETAQTQYYRLDLNGGEALPAFKINLGVHSLMPLGDGKFLFTSSLRLDEDEIWLKDEEEAKKHYKELKDKKFRTELERIPYQLNGVGLFQNKVNRLFLFDENSGEITAISAPTLNIGGVHLNKAKTRAFITANEVSAKAVKTDGIWELDIETLELKLLNEDTGLSVSVIAELGDRVILFASDMKNIGINQNRIIYEWDFEQGEAVVVDETELQIGSSVGNDVFYGRGRALATYEDEIFMVETVGSKSVLRSLDSSLGRQDILTRDGTVQAFAVLNGVTYILGFQDMKLAEIYKVVDEDSVEQVTHFNDDLYEEFEPIVPVSVNIPSPVDGCEIEGFVLLPEGYSKDSKTPAILNIHGGPKTAYGAVYHHEMLTWAKMGYAVFFCNPHGSSGRGDDFSNIFGKYGQDDYEDIMAFTDAVLAEYSGIDTENLAVTGGSYGGFMTNWIITQTDRFKVAATQRSISNWTSFYGSSDIGYYFATDQNDTTIEDEDIYSVLWNHSPMKYINNAKTPTLVIHADQDLRCPIEQGYQLYVGLLDRGVDSKMVVFHDETHELSRSGKPQAREERLRQLTDWFNKYLIASE